MHKSDHSPISGRLLTLFLAVFEANSVSRAADLLDVNQSSVSHGLDNLRDIFDDPLFIKSGRGITPTERAIALAPKVRSTLASMESLVKSSTYDPADDDRAITLAGNVDALSELFLLFRDRVFKSAPNVKINLIESGTRLNVERLLDLRQADVAIAARIPFHSGALDAAPILTSKMVCYTDPLANKPIDSVEAYIAARHAVVGFGKPGQSLVDEVLAQHNINRNVVLCAPSFFTLAKMMEGTDLVVTMPDYLSRTVFPSFSKHEPPIPFADVQVDLIWHRRSEQSGRNMWIRENVMASAADLQQRLKSER